MNKIVLPGQQVSIQMRTGEIDPIWYERLRALVEIAEAAGGGGGGGPITLTGDVTGTGTGTIPTTITAASITNAKLAAVAAYTLKGNPTGAPAAPSDFMIGSLTAKVTPVATDELLLQDNAAGGALKKIAWSSLPGGGGGGMSIGGAVTAGTPGSVLFIGPGPVLAQDNAKFFWDDTHFALRTWGGEIFLYLTDPSSSGNAFACGAGNFTCEGLGAHSNAAIGVGSMAGLTTGANNAAIGYFTLNAITTGGSNTAVGGNALQNLITGINNVGIGHLAGGGLTTGSANVALGANAASGMTTGNANLGIGFQSMSGITTGSSNVGIGPAAGSSISGTSASNVYIGGYSGPSTTQTSTVVISDGSGGASGLTPLLDWQLNTSQVWSMSNVSPVGLHLYNTTGSGGLTFPAVNYERAVLDWNITSNVFVIGTQAGGTGIVRPIKWAGLSNKTTPVGTDHLLLLDSTTSDTMKTVLVSALTGGGGGMAIGGAVTSGTSGSVLFIDGSGNLAQNNSQFFWDNTNLRLKVGSTGTPTGEYWVNGVRALFGVPNASGNNWFEAGAGNSTLTGYLNFGTGDTCMASLTTGYNNIAMGAVALNQCTAGAQNIALGNNALWFTKLDSSNVAIGYAALATLGNGGAGSGGNTGNIAIGFGSLTSQTTGANNIAIGDRGLSGITGDATGNTVIGANAGLSLGTSASGTVANNTFIGHNCGSNVQINSGSNAWIGGYTGRNSVSYFDSIALCNGIGSGANEMLDYAVTTSAWLGAAYSAWSFSKDFHLGQPAAVHIYNTQDSIGVATNYERGVLDWNVTSNVFVVGTPTGSAGGTGILRDTRFYTAGKLAIYRVANGSGDNWFEGNAGNFTATGYQNMATGDLALSSLTTGYQNCAVGNGAGRHLTDGYQNFIFGTSALTSSQSDSDNTAIGVLALYSLGNGGAGSGGNVQNVALGFAALSQIEQGAGNIAMGFNSLGNVIAPTVANGNVVIGATAGNNIGGGGGGSVNYNTLIGYKAGQNLTGASGGNTWIGGFLGPSSPVGNTIALSTNSGAGSLTLLDYHLTTGYTWSFNQASNTVPAAVHIYNSQDSLGVANNYERAIFDWNVTSNVFVIGTQKGGTGVIRLIAIHGFAKAGAPAAGDLPSGSFAMIDDTSAGQTWLCFNKAGTIRKVQLI